MLVNVLDALVAELQLLKPFFTGKRLKLFKNDHTPAEDDVRADYTEADFTGYAYITLDTWGDAYLNADDIAEIDEIIRTFEQTGTGTTCMVYGYFVTSTDDLLIWAERNPAGPVNMNADGKTYSVLPRQTLINQTA